MEQNARLYNPHLDGSPFLWEAGPVGVLLSHGFTATPVEVKKLARRLHAEGYTVSGPRLPGHGSTPDEMNRCRWQDWAAAIETAYQALAARCERVFVGGESMGALLTLNLAADHPEIAGVLAYSPALVINGLLPNIAHILGPLMAPFKPSLMKSQLDSAAEWQGYLENPVRAGGQLKLLRNHVQRRLGRIRQPVLVVQGRLDTTIAPNSGAAVLQGVASPHKVLHWMEASPHTVLLDCELEAIAALTLDFMRQVLDRAH